MEKSKKSDTNLLEKIFFYMLIFVPLALILSFFNLPPIFIFIICALGIIPLAKYIGKATEELSLYVGSGLGGLLNATFGNATELIIAIFALRAGLIEVVKASITGSIIGNILLVTGASMLAGGIYYKKQKFNLTSIMAGSSTLLLAMIGLIIPAIFLQTSPASATGIIEELSIFVSVFLLIVYFANLFFMLHTHKHLYTGEIGKNERPIWTKKKSIIVLLIATIFVSFLSEILVSSIEPLVQTFGWTELFIGVILIAIIGNAAEHTSSIIMAMKNRMDLALQISFGSATQIVMFVAPILVLISLFFATPMSLIFNSFELIALIVSVIIGNFVLQDGESNWLEGLQLLIAYAILAVAFFFHV